MAILDFGKYINSLPSTLAPNTVYFVKNGANFDLYMSTKDGSSAIPLNAVSLKSFTPIIPYLNNSSSKKIFGQVTNVALTTVSLTSSRIYLIPFISLADIKISNVAVEVTTAANGGSAVIGIYSNKLSNGNDQPDALLASTSSFSVASTGAVSASLSYTLTKNTVYWIALISNKAPTIRALPIGAVMPLLGTSTGSTASNTYYYSSGSGTTLPSSYNLSLTIANGVIPAIYFN
jgi:hypothetical protein